MALPVVVLYQAQAVPRVDGILKPKKPGGYADSGADIAYALQQSGQVVITLVDSPQVARDLDWLSLNTSRAGTTEKEGMVHWATEVHNSTSLVVNTKKWLPEKSLQ